MLMKGLRVVALFQLLVVAASHDNCPENFASDDSHALLQLQVDKSSLPVRGLLDADGKQPPEGGDTPAAKADVPAAAVDVLTWADGVESPLNPRADVTAAIDGAALVDTTAAVDVPPAVVDAPKPGGDTADAKADAPTVVADVPAAVVDVPKPGGNTTVPAVVDAPAAAVVAPEVEKKKPPDIMKIMMVTIGSAVLLAILFYGGTAAVARAKAADSEKWYHLSAEKAESTLQSLDVASCFAGIIIFFCSYGIAQEFIMTEEYGDEKFPSVPFIIMMNRVFLVLIASINMLASKDGINFATAKYTVVPAATVLISSFAQYSSLHYVTFPTQVVFKSAKIVPTMLLNRAINRVLQEWGDYVLALIITLAVIGFSLLAESAKDEIQQNTSWGIILLVLFLVCDALTSNTEKWIYTQDPAFTNTQMMFGMGIVTLIYSTIMTAVETGGFPLMITFLMNHPECIIQIIMLALTSTFGQWVIYYTVRKHGPVLLAIMMTVRQIISIYISSALYSHYIPPVAALCAAVAFMACLWKPFYKFVTADASQKANGDTEGKTASSAKQ